MSWLLDTSATIWKGGPAGDPNEALDLAALQLASWMIGNPTASFTAADPGVLAQAKIDITDATGKSAFPGPAVEQLFSDDGVQAQLIDPSITPIPEPAAWAMMLMGVFGVGALMRAKRRASLALAI